MGNDLTKFSRTTFELLNETFVAVSSGLLGLFVLITSDWNNNKLIPILLLSTLTIGCICYVYTDTETLIKLDDKLIVITGCDTGLGYSLAIYTQSIGFNVIVGCLDVNGKGASDLRMRNIMTYKLDLTEENDVRNFVKYIDEYLKENSNLGLWAVVNNAAVMTFGEFEWLTPSLIQQQVNINLIGTMTFTKYALPTLRKHKGRLITITSHCSQAVLPGLSVYGATKSALDGWCDGLRVELSKYEVKVIKFVPGSFVTQSNILSRQVDKFYEMQSNFTLEQRDFYGDYFKRYASYLSLLKSPELPQIIQDTKLYETYETALTEIRPKSLYVNETLRYKFYHYAFRLMPTYVRDVCVKYFMTMPEYEPPKRDIIV